MDNNEMYWFSKHKGRIPGNGSSYNHYNTHTDYSHSSTWLFTLSKYNVHDFGPKKKNWQIILQNPPKEHANSTEGDAELSQRLLGKQTLETKEAQCEFL